MPVSEARSVDQAMQGQVRQAGEAGEGARAANIGQMIGQADS
jgi:hypothetical protein